MDACGWLSVKQLVMYQTTVMVHKTFQTRKPYYLHERLSIEHSYRTRRETRYKSDIPRKSFRCRGASYYNSIPADIRTSMNMSTFKSKLKKWTRLNISLQ